jgi:DNA polymerase-3 subunit epsilon
LCKISDERITKKQAAELAAERGLVVAKSVTKKLDILVVADPHSMSNKAKKARDYGTRIIAEKVFWELLQIDAT